MLAKAARQSTQLDRVHIRYLGNGHLGFRPDGGSLLKSAKVSKTLLPHHSAPRLGSVCPNAGLNPWAAATRHPWRGAANPASCRVTHEFKPAFGQRGLTGRLRSRSKADQEQIKSGSLRIVVSVGCYNLQSCVDAAMAGYQPLMCKLTRRHRRQASSHRFDRVDSVRWVIGQSRSGRTRRHH